jgi:hypothetical protein
MDTTTRGPTAMGRPKKEIDATSMRLETDAYELARQAAAIFQESIVVYASRIVRQHAQADLLEDAIRRVKAAEQRAETPTPRSQGRRVKRQGRGARGDGA